MADAPPIVLVFAASDPTAGAGLQADVLAIAANGCHAVTVVTALTVQTTHGVIRIEPVAPALVEAQALALLEELPVAACKLGVVASAENARVIARLIRRIGGRPVVLDPVLGSGRGDTLADDNTLAALRAELVPLASIVTPNSGEARRLAGRAADTPLAECAGALIRLGARHVLVTGTHESTPRVINTLYAADGVVREDAWPRLQGSYHGSGCTLASALAARLAGGDDLSAAAFAAQDYTWRALRDGFQPATGQFLPNRLCAPARTRA